MFGLEISFGSLLMQAELFESVNTFATTIAVLVTTIGGIVTYAISTFRKATNSQLSERDKWMIELAKDIQMGFQKGAETIGSTKELAKIVYEASLSEEQRQEMAAKLIPIIERENIRLQKANEQAALIKAKLVEIFGESADVDLDKTIPREAKEISDSLRSASSVITLKPNTTNKTIAVEELAGKEANKKAIDDKLGEY